MDNFISFGHQAVNKAKENFNKHINTEHFQSYLNEFEEFGQNNERFTYFINFARWHGVRFFDKRFGGGYSR